MRSTSNAEAASQDPASMTEGRHISEHLDVQVLDGQLQANVMVLGWDEIESSTQLGGSTELQETDSKLHLQPSVPLYATVFPSHALERHDELQQPVESMDPFGGTGDDPFVGQATLPILTTTAVENPAEKDDEWEEFQAPEHDEGLAASGETHYRLCLQVRLKMVLMTALLCSIDSTIMQQSYRAQLGRWQWLMGSQRLSILAFILVQTKGGWCQGPVIRLHTCVVLVCLEKSAAAMQGWMSRAQLTTGMRLSLI